LETPVDPLARLREAIDRLDREFIRLLADRLRAVREIGDHKGRNKDAVLRDDDRERTLFEMWAREAESQGVSAYFAGRVLREILNWSRRDQERFSSPTRRAAPGALGARRLPGRAGCYSDPDHRQGVRDARRRAARARRLRSFAAAIDALEAGAIDYALLPIENTIAGSINEVYDLIGTGR